MECLLCLIPSRGQRLHKTSLSFFRRLQGTFSARTQCCLFYGHVSHTSHTGQNLRPQRVPGKGENSLAEPVAFGDFQLGAVAAASITGLQKEKRYLHPNLPQKEKLIPGPGWRQDEACPGEFHQEPCSLMYESVSLASGWEPLPKGIMKDRSPCTKCFHAWYFYNHIGKIRSCFQHAIVCSPALIYACMDIYQSLYSYLLKNYYSQTLCSRQRPLQK